MAEETYYDEREGMTTDTHKPARPLKLSAITSLY